MKQKKDIGMEILTTEEHNKRHGELPNHNKNMSETTKKIIGYVAVDSGQILLADPAYLKDWKDNEFNEKKKKKDFTYSGACNITLSKEMGGNFLDEKFKEVGVAVSSGYGDGCYPVEATYDDGRIKEVKIVFFK